MLFITKFVIMPLKVPVIKPKRIITGLINSIASSLLTKNKYARKSWAILWANAPKRLRPMGLKSLPNKTIADHITNVLEIPPPRLRAKAGPRKVPAKRLPTKTLMRVTVMPAFKP